MIGLIIRLIITVAVIGGLAVAARKLINLIKNLQPSDQSVRQDVEKFRLQLSAKNEDLVPWNKEEMELLSLKEIEQRHNRKGGKTIEGTMLSIYQEPMVQYVYKRYANAKNAVLFAKTSNREYIYRIHKKGIQIYLNNEPLGVLKRDGILYSKSNRQIAQIKPDNDAFSTPILVNNSEKGSLVNPKRTDRENPRAFELIAPMKKQEEDYFLSLAVLELSMRNISK